MIGFKVLPGDLIISCSGVTLGRIAEVPQGAKAGIINQALLKLTLDQSIMMNTFFINQFRSAEICCAQRPVEGFVCAPRAALYRPGKHRRIVCRRISMAGHSISD